MINPGPHRPSTRRLSIAWSTLPLKHPMILPDADSDSDSKKGRASSSHPRDGVVTRAGDDPSPPPTARLTPVSAPELPEPGPEPLPPYTPREIDPLLPGPARRRKCTWHRRVLQRGLPLLALAAVLAWAAVHTLHRRTLIIREVCQAADNWPWVDNTETDPLFYVEGATPISSALSEVHFTSVSPGIFGALEIVTPSLYNYKDIIVGVRAGHHDLNVLKRIVVCRREFANATVLVSLELLQPPPQDRVWVELSVQIPNGGYPKPGNWLAPNLTVEVASMNVSCPGDLARTVRFNALSLATTNGSITLGPTRADRIVLSANGHPLTADLQAGTSVSLANNDGPIAANVSILRENDPAAPSTVNVSGAGAIAVSVTPANATELAVRAASSTRDTVDVDIVSAPVGALLYVELASAEGLAHLALPPAFEGEYMLRGADGVLLTMRNVSDPAGRGRRRVGWRHWVEGNGIEGHTSWTDGDGEEPRPMGHARVIGLSAELEL